MMRDCRYIRELRHRRDYYTLGIMPNLNAILRPRDWVIEWVRKRREDAERARCVGDYVTCPKCGADNCFWWVQGFQIGRMDNPTLEDWVIVDCVDQDGYGTHICRAAE